MDRVAIVGASLAAVHAIEGLRDHDFAGEIVLVGDEGHLPYDRPPLSKEALRDGPEPELLREPDWYADSGVTAMLGQPARCLSTSARSVVLADGTDVPYDGLVITTGSAVRRLPTGNEHVHFLRSLDDAARLHERLVAAGHVAIIGAGFIGLEVAATVADMGHTVTVVEVAPVPLARVLGDEVGEWLHRFHARHGVSIDVGAPALAVERDGSALRVVRGGAPDVRADLVVGALGATPATGWLRGSGLALSDGVLCDRTLRTNRVHVVAAGDIARWYNPLFDENMRVEQWTNAVEQGRHAATTLLGGDETYTAVPHFWSDQFDAKIRFVGRANGAEQVHVESETDSSLVAVFARHGTVVGALCVNAPLRLSDLRAAILGRKALAEVTRR